MKSAFLIPVAALAATFAVHAQSPNPPNPPGSPGPGNVGPQHGFGPQLDHREQFRKMAEHFREQRGAGRFERPQAATQGGDSKDREGHIREALNHLKAAGLGGMAERIEQAIKGHNALAGNGPGRGPSGPQAGSPQGPGQGAQHHRFPFGGGGQPFAQPSPFGAGSQGEHHSRHHGHDASQPQGGNDDLRAQVQRLSRQVEELSKMVHSRGGQNPGGPRTNEPDRGERHEARPQGGQPQIQPRGRDGEHKDGPPQRRPEGDQKEPKREEARRDAPKPDGAVEEIKPAQLPHSDSLE